MSGKLILDSDSAGTAKEQGTGTAGFFTNAVGKFQLKTLFGSGLGSSSEDLVASQIKKIMHKVGGGAGGISSTVHTTAKGNDGNAVDSINVVVSTDDSNAEKLGK